jgi:putative spermidine/putrescine transport system permease protein
VGSRLDAPRAALRTPSWRARRRARLNIWTLLILPGAGFLILFFVVPLGGMLVRSLTDPSPKNYTVFTTSPLYGRVLWTTVWTSLVVALVCLVMAYPYAYALLIAGRRVRAVLISLLLLSLWSSLLVRTYAWTVLLQDTGVINDTLRNIGLISDPLPLIRTTTGVVIGMTQVLLPFMVLPIYAAMRRVDRDLLSAASSLGAPPWKVFQRVFLPLSLPGVLAGMLLVFVLSMGFYITPALLGSPQNAMFSELIANEISRNLNFGVASALSVILIVVTFAILAVASRFIRVRSAVGFESE